MTEPGFGLYVLIPWLIPFLGHHSLSCVHDDNSGNVVISNKILCVTRMCLLHSRGIATHLSIFMKMIYCLLEFYYLHINIQ